MADLDHLFGNDLSFGPGGDIAMVAGDSETQERVLRRLQTSAGGYLQQQDYGAGVASFIGKPSNILAIGAVLRQQMKLEAGVLQIPPPNVLVVAGENGIVTATISYTSALTSQPQSLSFPIGV